jgi:hypothetical protein
MKCFFLPAVLGTTGIVIERLKNILKQYQERIEQLFYKKKKTAVLVTSHIIVTVLQSET